MSIWVSFCTIVIFSWTKVIRCLHGDVLLHIYTYLSKNYTTVYFYTMSICTCIITESLCPIDVWVSVICSWTNAIHSGNHSKSSERFFTVFSLVFHISPLFHMWIDSFSMIVKTCLMNFCLYTVFEIVLWIST